MAGPNYHELAEVMQAAIKGVLHATHSHVLQDHLQKTTQKSYFFCQLFANMSMYSKDSKRMIMQKWHEHLSQEIEPFLGLLLI